MTSNPMTVLFRRSSLALMLAAAGLTGCASLRPDYQTPASPVPTQLAVAVSSSTGTVAPGSDWRAVVTDARLRQAIELTLAHNRDLKIAALNIEQARATYRIDASAQWPALKGTASSSHSHSPAEANSSGVASTSRQQSVAVGISAYELDFFGRVRDLQDAALQAYLNTEQARRSTELSLVAQVANAWLTLAADQTLSELAQQTLATQQATYDKTEASQRLGGASVLTLVQARSTLEAARVAAANAAVLVVQDRNALDLLVGTALPESALPGAWPWQPDAAVTPAAAQLSLPPAGLSSELLRRRPDVLAAEHALQAANANLGAARAALFPSISLTASAGTASRSLSDLFKGGAWSFVPSVSLPLLDGGASRAGVDTAEAALGIERATYEKTVQTAFSEVANALAVRASMAGRLQAQQDLVRASERLLELAQARYDRGADSYLTVLDAQRTHLAAQQALISLQLADQNNRITLYKALGGGWADTEVAALNPPADPAR